MPSTKQQASKGNGAAGARVGTAEAAGTGAGTARTGAGAVAGVGAAGVGVVGAGVDAGVDARALPGAGPTTDPGRVAGNGASGVDGTSGGGGALGGVRAVVGDGTVVVGEPGSNGAVADDGSVGTNGSVGAAGTHGDPTAAEAGRVAGEAARRSAHHTARAEAREPRPAASAGIGAAAAGDAGTVGAPPARAAGPSSIKGVASCASAAAPIAGQAALVPPGSRDALQVFRDTGSHEAFHDLHAETHDMAVRAARKRLRRRDLVEDACQDAFTRIYAEGRDGGVKGRSAVKHASRTAGNAAKSIHEKEDLRRKREAAAGISKALGIPYRPDLDRVPLGACPERAPRTEPTPEERVACDEAVAQLAPLLRRCFELQLHQGLGPREIAGMLKVPEKRVRGWLDRATDIVRKELAPVVPALVLPALLAGRRPALAAVGRAVEGLATAGGSGGAGGAGAIGRVGGPHTVLRGGGRRSLRLRLRRPGVVPSAVALSASILLLFFSLMHLAFARQPGRLPLAEASPPVELPSDPAPVPVAVVAPSGGSTRDALAAAGSAYAKKLFDRLVARYAEPMTLEPPDEVVRAAEALSSAPPGSAEVAVVGEDGELLREGEVRISIDREDIPPFFTAQAVIDAASGFVAGEAVRSLRDANPFRIETIPALLDGVTIVLSLESPGWIEDFGGGWAFRPKASEAASVTARAVAGRVTRVIVRDRRTGEPIEGARVTVARTAGFTRKKASAPPGNASGRECLTDAYGVAAPTTFGGGPWEVAASATGYRTGTRPEADVPEEIDVWLDRLRPVGEGGVRVLVLDAWGAPVPGAKVALVDAAGEETIVEADAEGRRIFEDLPAGETSVSVSYPGGVIPPAGSSGSIGPETVAVRHGGALEMTFGGAAGDGVEVRGDDASGDDAILAEASAGGGGGSRDEGAPADDIAEVPASSSDADAWGELAAAAGGSEGGEPAGGRHDGGAADDGTSATSDLVLEGTRTVDDETDMVTWEFGPALKARDRGEGGGSGDGTTGEDGEPGEDGVPDEEGPAGGGGAQADGGAREDGGEPGGGGAVGHGGPRGGGARGAGLRGEDPGRGTVRVVVTDGARRPVAGATAWLIDSAKGSEERQTDAKGECVFRNVLTGDLSVDVSAPWGREIRLPPGASPFGTRILVLRPGETLVVQVGCDDERGALEATVVDESDRPAPGLEVRLKGCALEPPAATTDAEGRVLLDRLTAGRYSAAVRVGETSWEFDWRLDVEAKKTLRRRWQVGAGTVRGVVLLPRDTGKAPRKTILTPMGPMAVPAIEPHLVVTLETGGREARVTPRPDGGFAIEGVPEGDHMVQAVYTRDGAGLEVETLKSLAFVKVPPGGEVEGVVIIVGKEVQVTVTVLGPDGLFVSIADVRLVTDAGHAIRLHRPVLEAKAPNVYQGTAAPGTYRLVVKAPGFETHERELRVAEDAPVDLEVKIAASAGEVPAEAGGPEGKARAKATPQAPAKPEPGGKGGARATPQAGAKPRTSAKARPASRTAGRPAGDST